MKFSGQKAKFIQPSSLIVAIIIVVSVLGLIYSAVAESYSTFALSYNNFGLISAIITIFNILIAVLIIRSKSHSEDIQWFLLYVYAVIIFGLSQVLQACSVYPTAANFWEHLGGIGIIVMPAAMFLFVKSYTRSIEGYSVWVVPAVVICCAILSFFYATDNILPITEGQKFSWGYYSVIWPQPGYTINLIWFGALTVLSLSMLIKFYLNVSNPVLKKQSLLYILAISLPAVVALFTDGILPGFHIGQSIPPLGLVFTSISAFAIFYGYKKFRLFRLNPQLLSENVLDTMDEAVVVTNSDFKIETYNPRLLEITNKTDNQINGINLATLFTTQSWEKIYNSIANSSDVNDGINTIILYGENNSFIPVRVSKSTLLEDNHILGYVFAISDITELQLSYNALQKEKNSIEQKVLERTKELQDAQKRLAQTDKIKTEFVTLTSHNLRTPLTIINGNLELLESSNLDDNQKKLISTLNISTKQLKNYIEELLTISKIESGTHTQLQKVYLKNILDPIIQEAQSLAVTTHNQFNYYPADKEIVINANVERLSSAIIKIFDNAFKFTSKGNVNCYVLIENGNLRIVIKDTGIGISKQELPNLFTKFHRSNGDSQYSFDYSGQGLGLFFAKLIITEHGGQIYIESQQNVGTTAIIALPCEHIS